MVDGPYFVTVPLANVVESHATLKLDVRRWLIANVGDNRNSFEVENAIWDWVGIDADNDQCLFSFQSQEKAALFKMFYS